MLPTTTLTTLNALQQYMNHVSKSARNNISSDILEPYSTIIRLALLVYFPRGTKITIKNNSIKYDKPGFFQGPIRWSKGNGREELHHLCKPIERYSKIGKIPLLTNLAIRGVQRLQQSYQTDTTITSYSLEYFNKLLKSNLKNMTKEEKEERKADENIFYDLWTHEEFEIMILLFKQLSNTNLDLTVSNLDNVSRINKKKYYVQAIMSILESKDECVKFKIHEATNKLYTRTITIS